MEEFGKLKPPLALCYVHQLNRDSEAARNFWDLFNSNGLPTIRFAPVWEEIKKDRQIEIWGRVGPPDPRPGDLDDAYYDTANFGCLTNFDSGDIYEGSTEYVARKGEDLDEFKNNLKKAGVKNILFGGVSIGL